MAYDKKAGKRKRLAREEENRQLKRYKSECRELDTYFMSEDELIRAKERQKITKIKNKAIVQRAYMIAMATN
nr:MAG TPA_asm: hypothetical protein [Caudoviricetes sp.]